MMTRWVFMDAGDTFIYGYPTLYKALRDCWPETEQPETGSIQHLVKEYKHIAEGCDLTSQNGFEAYFLGLYRYVLEELGYMNDLNEKAAELWQLWENGKHLRLFDDSKAALKMLLNNGYQLGIISNWDQSLEPLLQRWGVFDLFSVCIRSTAVGVMKPDERIFEIAFTEAGVRGESCWFLGDQLNVDIIPAKNLGMKTVLVDYYGRYECADKADYIVPSMSMAAIVMQKEDGIAMESILSRY